MTTAFTYILVTLALTILLHNVILTFAAWTFDFVEGHIIANNNITYRRNYKLEDVEESFVSAKTISEISA